LLTPLGHTADDYWAALYRRRGIIVFMIILTAAFSAFFSQRITPLYESKAKFYVPQDVVLTRGGPEQGGMRVPGLKDQARAFVAVLEAADAYRAVADQLPGRSRSQLFHAADFDVSPAASIVVYARDKDPGIASKMAMLFVEYFRTFHSKIMRRDLSAAISKVEKRLADVEQGKRRTDNARWSYLREHRLGAPDTAMSELESERARFDDRLRSAAVELRAATERVASLERKLQSEEAAYQAGQVAAGVSDGLYAKLRSEVTAAQVTRDTIVARHAALLQTKQETADLISDLTTRLQKIREFDDERARNQVLITRLRRNVANLRSELLRLKDAVVMVEKPVIPSEPVYPIVWLNVLVGAMGGLLLGIIYSLFLDHLQRRRRDRRLQQLNEAPWVEDAFDAWMERRATR